MLMDISFPKFAHPPPFHTAKINRNNVWALVPKGAWDEWELVDMLPFTEWPVPWAPDYLANEPHRVDRLTLFEIAWYIKHELIPYDINLTIDSLY